MSTANGESDTGGGGEDSSRSEEAAPEIKPVKMISPPPKKAGGDNSIREFGHEADGEQAAAMVAGLTGYLDARAKRDYGRACAFMAGADREFGQAAGPDGRVIGCAGFLKGVSAGLDDEALRGLAIVRVGSVRVDGDQGFVIFKGDHNFWMTNPMALEDGVWKSTALAPSSLP